MTYRLFILSTEFLYSFLRFLLLVYLTCDHHLSLASQRLFAIIPLSPTVAISLCNSQSSHVACHLVAPPQCPSVSLARCAFIEAFIVPK
jgi:hypothetical protein